MTDYEFMMECKEKINAVVEEVTNASRTWEEIDEYFYNSTVDVEYRIDGEKKYKSVEVLVCFGSPNIVIDTGSRSVKLYWETTKEEMVIPDNVAYQIDAYWSEIYEEM